MYTGTSDLQKLGNLARWKYRTQSSSYDDQCGAIDGSTGELWPPSAVDEDYIKIFASDICR